MARMIGVPDRFIATQPTDVQMVQELNRLIDTESEEEHSQLITKDGEAVLRTMYPSIASQTSCIDCHNRIQKPETPWQIGDVMGAYVIDRGVQHTLNRYMIYSIITGVLVSLLMLSVFVVRYQNFRLQRHAKHLNKLATTDALTDCLNRRAMDEISVGLEQNKNPNAALLALDIDHFKHINDTYGHEVGDQALIWFSQAVRAVIREKDVFARIGGEEFTVYLRDVSEDEALKVAERICSHVASTPFYAASNKIDITVSIGAIHMSKAPSNSMSACQQAADGLLYTAKKSGRNQVVWSAPMKHV